MCRQLGWSCFFGAMFLGTAFSGDDGDAEETADPVDPVEPDTTVNGDGADNTIAAEAGQTINAGGGDDLVTGDADADGVVVDGGAGNDTVQVGGTYALLRGGHHPT